MQDIVNAGPNVIFPDMIVGEAIAFQHILVPHCGIDFDPTGPGNYTVVAAVAIVI